MAEIDVKFMKGNRALARAMGNKIKPDPKKGATKSASTKGGKKK